MINNQNQAQWFVVLFALALAMVALLMACEFKLDKRDMLREAVECARSGGVPISGVNKIHCANEAINQVFMEKTYIKKKD